MKRIARVYLAFLLLLLFSHGAGATQNSFVAGNFPTVSPYPGLTLVQNINTAMTVLSSNNAGSSAPSYALSDMLWADTTNNLLKFTPNGTSWYPLGGFGNSTWTAASDGVLDDAITATGSSNAYVVTYSPAPSALVTGHVYKFFTNFSNTASATVNFNALGAITLKKLGGTSLANGDLANNQFVACAYDGTYCQITSQLATSGGGGITSVATTSPVCGGTITSTGTISLCAQANNTVLANISGSSASPSATATPVATSWSIGTTSSASGTGMHSASTNTLGLTTNGTDAITAYSDQGLATVGATGGDQGSGTINATGLYVNGVSVTNGSAMILLHTQTCTSGSPCSSVSFGSSYLTSTYSTYILQVSGLYFSNTGAIPALQISTNNGSSWVNSGYSNGGIGFISSGSGAFSNGQTGYFALAGCYANACSSAADVLSATSSNPAMMTLTFSNPSASQAAWFNVSLTGSISGIGLGIYNGFANNSGTTPFNAIRILDESGSSYTINGGTFSLYGLNH